MEVHDQEMPKLIADDLLWLQKLKDEFDFSNQEAINLKKMMRGSYEDAYQFCLNDTFEDWDLILIHTCSWDYDKEDTETYIDHIKNNRSLQAHMPGIINPRNALIKVHSIRGLAYHHLRGRYWLDKDMCRLLPRIIENLGINIAEGLVILFEKKDSYQKALSIERQASREKPEALQGMIHELRDRYGNERLRTISDDDLEHLNYFHLCSLLDFYDLGLRASMLRARNWFNSDDYIKALASLIRNDRLEPSNAIRILGNLEFFQVYGVAKGLTLEEVKKLKSHAQVEILSIFKKNGVAIVQLPDINIDITDKLELLPLLLEHMNAQQALNVFVRITEEMTDFHLRALEIFLKSGMKIDQAIELIINVNHQQALCITDNIDFREVVDLNKIQAQALRYLHGNGLTGDHLRGKDWFNCPYHKDVLVYLVRKLNFTIANALEIVNGTNWLQILNILKDLSRLDLSNLNHYHIMALLKLNRYGLKKEHLVGCAWFNSAKHKDYLVYLMIAEKMNAIDAMKLLQSKRNLHDLIVMHNDIRLHPPVEPLKLEFKVN